MDKKQQLEQKILTLSRKLRRASMARIPLSKEEREKIQEKILKLCDQLRKIEEEDESLNQPIKP